jgi:hypothetical protein
MNSDETGAATNPLRAQPRIRYGRSHQSATGAATNPSTFFQRIAFSNKFINELLLAISLFLPVLWSTRAATLLDFGCDSK